MRLLLVEDDARLAGAVRSWMGHAAIDVDWVTTGAEIETALRRGIYDWLVLDLGLPDVDGEEALRGLRAAGFDLPVVVVTAREQVQDRVRLLDLGADDFLVKPVHLDELAARLRAVRRRQGSTGDIVLRHGALVLVPASRTVSLAGRYIALTNREFWLLETLMAHHDRVVTREALIESLHGWNEDIVGNALDVHVHNLRRKLGRGVIRTVRGVGFTLYPQA
ncbi:MAG: response regulator [Burkholderiales bacterium]|nr:response regulator [Burkholderiales bacterium]